MMDEVVAATGAERGFVMPYAADGLPVFRAARAMDHSTIDDLEFQISRGVVERLLRCDQPILTSDAQAHERIGLPQSVGVGLTVDSMRPAERGQRRRLRIRGQQPAERGFTLGDGELLSPIASSATIASEDTRLHEFAVEKGRLETSCR